MESEDTSRQNMALMQTDINPNEIKTAVTTENRDRTNCTRENANTLNKKKLTMINYNFKILANLLTNYFNIILEDL